MLQVFSLRERANANGVAVRRDDRYRFSNVLGSDAVAKAKFSFMLGGILVLLIMVGYYRFSGFISIVALVINIMFIPVFIWVLKMPFTILAPIVIGLHT